MKQPVPFVLRAILSIVLATFYLQAWGLDCAPADIALTNQAEVDALSVTECTSITGSLRIVGFSITSLEGLSNITSVGRDLFVDSADALTNLEGLSSLTSVGQTLIIQSNHALTSLVGLTNLVNVGRNMSIESNGALTSLDGLASLTNVGINLSISKHRFLTNLDGLTNITSVGSNLSISDNDALTNLDGLSEVASVVGSLVITGNPQLGQCSSVSRLLDQSNDAEPGPGPGVGGIPDIGEGADIRDNLSGCNSVAEILATANPIKINAGLNDAWYDPETSGQGFFITVFPDLGYVPLAWFTYDTELPPIGATANLGDPGHRWLTAVGPIEGSQVLMNIEMTSGGIFDSATEIIRTDPPGSDGTILLTFDSCNSGTVEYDIPSINRQGTVPIQRVADDNIALCEALNSNSDQPLFPAR